MARLTRSDMTNGTPFSLTAASATGDTFPNDDRTFLYAANSSGAPITVTIPAQKSTIKVQDGGSVTVDPIAVAIAAGASAPIIAPPALYNDGNGEAHATYSTATGLTVAAIRRQDT